MSFRIRGKILRLWRRGLTKPLQRLANISRFAECGLVQPTFAVHTRMFELLENVFVIAGAHPYSAADFDDDARAYGAVACM